MQEGSARHELARVSQDLSELFKIQPDLMRTLSNLVSMASQEGVISTKIKELMAIAIAVALRCDDCILFHLEKAIKHGVTKDEVAEAISVAIEMGGGPASVYGAGALRVYDELRQS